MKRVYKNLFLGYLLLFLAGFMFGTMIDYSNGLTWVLILKILLFWQLVNYGFIIVNECNTEIYNH